MPYIVPNDFWGKAQDPPSVVGFDENGRVIGEAAATECTRCPNDFALDTKTPLLTSVDSSS